MYFKDFSHVFTDFLAARHNLEVDLVAHNAVIRAAACSLIRLIQL